MVFHSWGWRAVQFAFWTFLVLFDDHSFHHVLWKAHTLLLRAHLLRERNWATIEPMALILSHRRVLMVIIATTQMLVVFHSPSITCIHSHRISGVLTLISRSFISLPWKAMKRVIKLYSSIKTSKPTIFLILRLLKWVALPAPNEAFALEHLSLSALSRFLEKLSII